jgi:hypothetical protein
MSLAPALPLPPECLAANAAIAARWDRLARDARRETIYLLMTLHAATGIETARLAFHFAQTSTLRCRVRARKPADRAMNLSLPPSAFSL